MLREAESRDVARAALLLAITESREEEARQKNTMAESGIHCAAADYGGDFTASVGKLVERAVVSAKREGLIQESHREEGAVAGAAHEALEQVADKALGLSIGGKIAVARRGEHVAVAVFFGVGLGHLNEVSVGLGHRSI